VCVNVCVCVCVCMPAQAHLEICCTLEISGRTQVGILKSQHLSFIHSHERLLSSVVVVHLDF